MSPPTPITRGAAELRRLLTERTLDVRALDTAGFRLWLERHLARWAGDPVFVQRTRIRDIRRAHPRLRALEREERNATAAYRASPLFGCLQRVERELGDAGKAISGLEAALERAAPDRRPAMRRKLAAFRAREGALREERADLTQGSGERQRLDRVVAELGRLRAGTGAEREEACLRQLLREWGRGSGRRGAAFERRALAGVRRCLVPELPREEGDPEAGPRLRVLRGVTLGAARVEIDGMVIRPAAAPGEPVEVLAIVEVKRNLNDLAHGFRLRQENLAWLTGDGRGYDPALYRTGSFPEGRFDRAAVHEQGGARYVLDRGSFRRFRPDPDTGMFLDGLYLATRPGAIWGVSGGALARIAHRVASDERWDPGSEAYLGQLLEWCRSLAGPLETPEVLGMFAASESRGRQVLLLER